MVVVPETLLGRPRVPDPAGETELIRRFVEANLHVIESSEVAQIRYSQELGQIIKEADIKAMKALCAKYHCDIFVAGEAFSEQVNQTNVRNPSQIVARARIEVKAFIVETGEILAANSAVATGTDYTPAIAGKTALQHAGDNLADYLLSRIKAAINEGRIPTRKEAVEAKAGQEVLSREQLWRRQYPPYVLYGVGGGLMALVFLTVIGLFMARSRRLAPPGNPPPHRPDSKL
jgi:hypothetical protein